MSQNRATMKTTILIHMIHRVFHNNIFVVPAVGEKLLQQEQWAYLSTHPSKRLNSFCYDDDDDEDYTYVITPDEPVLSTEELDNSLKISSGSTTTHPDISLLEYEVFYDDNIKEINSGSPTTHSDSSLYASLIFDLSINPLPPADRSDSYEFTDELIPFISPPEYDCFLFKANDAILKNMQTNMTSLINSNLELKNMFGQFMKMNTASSLGSGTLPSNTITNPKEDLKGITTRSGTAYQGPTIPTTFSSLPPVVEREIETESLILNSEPIVAPIIEPVNSPVSALKPNQRPSIPYPLRFQDQKLHDKANEQQEKFFQIFKDLNFNISFDDALILMPKFGLSIKSLLTNKDKICKLARTPLNEHCSAVLLKKLPEKLGDPDKFLISCDFPKMAECLALTDLDASINLIPLFVWNKLYLLDLSPTCMTLELADRLISPSVGVAEDFFVKVGTFHFLADFVVVDFDADPREDFKLAVQHQRRVNPKIYDIIKNEVVKIPDAGLIYPIYDSPWVSPVHCIPKKGGFTIVKNEENELIPTRLVTGWRVCIDYQRMLKRCEDTTLCLNWEKSHFMVEEGIVLGHKISKNGIEVDKAKVDVIAKLPHPTTIKVLGQHQEKLFRPVHYSSKTMTEAESNYTTTKKEMFAVVYAFEKFWSYLIMNKSIVYMDHSTLKYLFAKKDFKARLLRWVKENPKKDKIESKPDKKGKRGEARKSQKQLQWIEQEKLNKMQKEGSEMQTHAKSTKALKKERKEEGQSCNFMKVQCEGAKLPRLQSGTLKDSSCN
uniref:Reverse transcriptase domain-containing protein n=1 Tax=Tanacetum cinerariifolium TaxID=118510 RepID=A0A6L2P2D0_TANCI|nr:reverse transcriptase domain-containing protein [Tanacetum cinerariifolium]